MLIAAAYVRGNNFQNHSVITFSIAQFQLRKVNRPYLDLACADIRNSTIGCHNEFSPPNLAVCSTKGPSIVGPHYSRQYTLVSQTSTAGLAGGKFARAVSATSSRPPPDCAKDTSSPQSGTAATVPPAF